MKLTAVEQAMLDGEQGRFKQAALQKIVQYAQVLGAEELCEVSMATVYLGAHPYLDAVDSDNYDEIFSKMVLCTDETVPVEKFAEGCMSQTCVSACDQYEYECLHLSREKFEKNRRYLEITREAGVNIVNSCTPYLTGWIPLRGEHFVTTESSNVLICNSLFSACGNADGLEAAAWSAICGRTPKWGNHIMENRLGTCRFVIDCPSATDNDWDIIGFTIGRMLPNHGIPIIDGNFERPNLIKLKQCFAALATTSCAEMCHIIGITPEAVTLDMATGGRDVPTFTVTEEEYRKSWDMLCEPGGGDVDLVILGCPHFTLHEIEETAKYLEGKTVKPGVRLLIFTDIPLKELANVNGYTKLIEQAGAHLLTSGCPLVFGKQAHEGSVGIVCDSSKQAHYLKSESDAPVYYGDKFACMDAAVQGKWRG